MVSNQVFLVILAMLSIDYVVSLPMAQPVQMSEFMDSYDDNSTFLETRNTEVTLPLKIKSREDLISWVTYAMRIMASRINITIGTDNLPEEFIESEDGKLNKTAGIERVKSIMKESNKGKNSTKESMPDLNEIRKTKSDEEPLKNTLTTPNVDTSTKPTKSPSTPINRGVLNSYGQRQNYPSYAGGFLQQPQAQQNLYYARPEHQIFRDPNVFPPFAGPGFFPLPIDSRSSNEQLLAHYYALTSDQIGKTVTPPGQNGEIAIVQLRKTTLPITTTGTANTPAQFGNSGTIVYRENPTSEVPPTQTTSRTTGTTVTGQRFTLPFEAVITITRDEDGNELKDVLETTMFGDNKFGASTREPVDAMVVSPPQKEKKKSKGTKTSSDLEDDGDKDEEPKKKKKLTFWQTVLGALTGNSKKSNGSTSNGKSRKTKSTRGNRAGTEQRQENEEVAPPGNSDDGSDNEISDEKEPDIFDVDTGSGPGKTRQDYGGGSDYGGEEDQGSLGSIEDLLPLAIPILEDLSDPESDVDLAELLAAGVPLLQGLSEGDEDTPSLAETLLPILQNLSKGKDGGSSDVGAIIGPLITLIGPLIGPLSGPLIAPLSRASSNPNDGSSLATLLQAALGPLSQPTEEGGVSPIAAVVTKLVSHLSAELSSPDSPVDFGSLIGSVVAGAISGTSAGLSNSKPKPDHKHPGYGPSKSRRQGSVTPNSGGLSPPGIDAPFTANFGPATPVNDIQKQKSKSRKSRKQKPQQEFRPAATHPEPQSIYQPMPPEQPQQQRYPQQQPQPSLVQAIQQPSFGQPVQQQPVYHHPPPPVLEQVAAPGHTVPAHTVNSFDLLGNSLKQIAQAGAQLVSAILGTSINASKASSTSASDSSDKGGHHGGGYPPHDTYGPPQDTYGPPGYH